MKRVVLLAINAKFTHSSLSVWALAGGVSRYASIPHDVSIVEATIQQADSDIADQVTAFRPDVVGISTYIWNAGKLPGLLKLLRERLPEAVFVLGGPEASHNAEYWLERGADYVLKGEGERSFAELLDELELCEAEDARNLITPTDANTEVRPLSTPKAASADIHSLSTADISTPADSRSPDDPIDPYTDEYFAALGGRMAYLETSRGCPYKCAFCLSAGSGVRFFPLEFAKRQIDKLSQAGAKTIKLVDRTFNCDAARAYELFEYVIGMNTGSRFHFEVAADLFDERTLSLLGAAPPGRIQLEAGVQSYFEPALKAASRQTDHEKAERSIRALLKEGSIHIHVDLIAGLPYETLADFVEGFDRAYSLGAHTLQLGFLKLLHGSELRKQAESLGINYSEMPPYEILSSYWLSTDDILILKQAENALQHTYNKSRFLSSLEYTFSVSAAQPFELFHIIGEAAPNHGTDLSKYAEQIYGVLARLKGVDESVLCDRMVRDWLSMVKGKNMPGFLRNPDKRRAIVAEAAEEQLGRKVRRDESAILLSGEGVFVDSETRDPVTGLYKVHTIKVG